MSERFQEFRENFQNRFEDACKRVKPYAGVATVAFLIGVGVGQAVNAKLGAARNNTEVRT